jgi:3-hydroxyacyl-CoA dehydrogenase
VQTIETVAVLGASDDGTACAVLAALAGCAVRVHGADATALDRAGASVRRRVELAFAQGVLTRTEVQRILDGVLFTRDLDEALTGADLLVDADGAGSADLARRLSAGLRASSVVAVAGEADPRAISAHLSQPGRVLTLRLAQSAGPVPRLEVTAASGTTEHALERARHFAARVNRAARLAVGP